jgi:hypothetical protein
MPNAAGPCSFVLCISRPWHLDGRRAIGSRETVCKATSKFATKPDRERVLQCMNSKESSIADDVFPQGKYAVPLFRDAKLKWSLQGQFDDSSKSFPGLWQKCRCANLGFLAMRHRWPEHEHDGFISFDGAVLRVHDVICITRMVALIIEPADKNPRKCLSVQKKSIWIK